MAARVKYPLGTKCKLCGAKRRSMKERWNNGVCWTCYDTRDSCPKCGGRKSKGYQLCQKCRTKIIRRYPVGCKCTLCGKKRRNKKQQFRRGLCSACYNREFYTPANSQRYRKRAIDAFMFTSSVYQLNVNYENLLVEALDEQCP